MVVGGGIAGMQSALDLANSGYYVYMLEKSSAVGGMMSQLDKTFPELSGEAGHFTATVNQKARYVDISKCTSCGECIEVCPIEVPNEYDKGLSKRKAIYKQYAQAIPGAFAISKTGTAPCKATCPAHVSIQGYIALINEGKYREALELFKEDHPFPGICGRICHHPCEEICTRNDLDQPLAIRELHRFLADWELGQDATYIPETAEPRKEKVAIVGSGPAGLAAAYSLARDGYQVTVFEKLPVVGGMMAVGIPEYRLPRDIINGEIKVIEEMGVTIKTGITFGKDITIESLKKDGFSALFMAIGLHGGRRLGVEKMLMVFFRGWTFCAIAPWAKMFPLAKMSSSLVAATWPSMWR